ncbi:hypothetical protein LQW54_004364 [Pestalotiopsis sp. IQ-011]
MMALSTICVVLRIYVRGVMIKTFGLDDAVMVLAFLAAIGSMVCLVQETKYGAGRHFMDIRIDEFVQLAFWQYIFLVLFTLSCDLTLALQCIPPMAAYAFPRPIDAQCFSADTFLAISTFNGVMNILTDAVFVLLPVPIIVKLQVNSRTKLSLLFILSLGLFCSLSKKMTVFPDLDLFSLRSAELHTGIVAACLPALRPLFSSLLENTSRRLRATGYLPYDSSLAARYGHGSHKYGSRRSNYHRQDEDAVGLHSLSSQHRKHLEDGGGGAGGYNARVTSASGAGVSRGDDGSGEEGILAPPRGAVIKTTQIVVTEGRNGCKK